jgi:phage minor structural protein
MEMIIHVLDKKTEQIVATLENKNGYPALFWDDRHIEKEENNYNTYEFTTIDDGNNPAAEYLTVKNKIVIRDLDGYFIPFTIEETEQDSSGGQRVKRIYAEGEHMELRTAKIIEPTELIGATINTALDYVLQGSRWQRGITEFAGSRTIKTTEYTTALAFLNKIAFEFNVQLRFRVEIDGNKIIGRYVDALLIEDVFDGKEITFGKDVIGIRRIENSGEIYTALYAIGPADENGKYVTIENVNAGLKYVEDREALERWSPDGRHLYGIFQYQPEADEKVTPELVKQKAQEALKNYIDSVVKYEVQGVALERITGLEHEKIRRGMTVRIKDEKFNPPLYLEARVLETERSYTAKDRDTFVLGNYREVEVVKDPTIAKIQSKLFRNENAWSSSARVIRSATPPEDKHAIWIDITKNPEVPMTYDFTTNEWKKASPTVAEEIGAETPAGAQQKANQAENNAKSHADTVAQQAENNAKEYAEGQAQQAEQNAKDYADQAKQQAIQQAIQEAEQKVNQAKTELENEIATKVDATWVNGQLVLKENAITKSSTAPSNPTANQLWLDTSVTPNVLKRWNGSSWVKVTPTSAGEVGAYTKTEVDNALNSKVSVTQYNIDMNSVVTRLNSAESRITQTEQEIATKVSNTQYQQDKAALENDISALETRMSNAETAITQNANQIALKANKTDVYTKTEIDGQFNTVNQQISQLNAELSVQAGEIATKVSRTEFESLKIGGRNILRKSAPEDLSQMSGHVGSNSTSTVELVDEPSAPKGKAIKITKTNNQGYSNSGGRYFRVPFKLEVSKPYSWSIKVKGTGTLNIGQEQGGQKSVTLTDQYQEITHTFTANSSQYYQFVFYGTGNFEVYFHSLKLEEGNKPTAWSPAPEDVQGQIDGLGTRLTTAETSITQLSDQITLKANKSEVDTLTNRISNAESQINILSDEIELRVEKDGVVSAINQSPESIKIQASKIDITGAVTFSSLSSTLQQSFNADGTVKTSRLSGTIVDSQIASAATWNTIKDRVNSWTVSGKTTINGGLIETNTIFAQQIAIADFTNLCQINEFTNPNGHTVVTISNKKYFKIGQAAYSKIKFAESRSVEFKVGDEYYFSFDGYKESAINTVNAIIRYYYSDGSWANAGSASVPITTTEGRVSVTVKITNSPDPLKTLNRIEFFLEKDNTSTGYYYLRSLELRKKYSGELIVDGVIEAKHIKSLNGLNVNNQFIVDANGNVTFKGTLNGATGTFSGNISTQADAYVGNNIYLGQPTQYGIGKGIVFNDQATITSATWSGNTQGLYLDSNHISLGAHENIASAPMAEIHLDKDGSITLASKSITLNGYQDGITSVSDIQMINGAKVKTDQGWLFPTLLNGWTNYGSGYETAGYYKDALGFIRLKGLIKGGTMGTAAFVLPAGFRPSYRKIFTVLTAGGVGRVDVDPSGNVLIMNYGTASNGWVSLDVIIFNT